MSSTERAFPEPELPEEEIPELNIVIARFDQARHEFNAAAEAYGSDPSASNQSTLGLCGSLVVRSFRQSAGAILKAETDWSARASILCNLLLQEDEDRVNVFRKFIPCPDFETLRESGADSEDEDTLESRIRDLAIDADGEEFAQEIVEAFSTAVQEDLNHFVGHVQEMHQETTPNPLLVEKAPKPSLLRTIGEHALDIGKIGAGVFIGILAAKQLRRGHR